MMIDFCEIIVKGHLNIDWSEWFEGLTIAYTDRDETLFSGPIRDQAALYGIIAKVRDMGLCLISVKCRAGESAQDSSKKPGTSPGESAQDNSNNPRTSPDDP